MILLHTITDAKKSYTVAQVAETLEEPEEEIRWIVEIAKKYEPEYDERQILQEVMWRRFLHAM